jgi:transcriptional regulator with XRE-family HTH domain
MTAQHTIGHIIRTWRSEHGITQAELAPMLGISISTLSNWETNRTTPGQHHRRILQQLDCHVPDLLIIDTDRLRAWRHRQDLTQANLADLVGVSHSTVAKWEAEGSTPEARTTAKLIALGCPTETAPIKPHKGFRDENCPHRETCQELSQRGLWCLCETEPPLEADLIAALDQDPDLEQTPLPIYI